MFIYTGKLDCEHASKEMITVVFPAEFQLNDPVSAYWQWSNDPKLHKKNTSVANSSFICTVTKTPDGSVRRIHFSFGSYSFDGTFDNGHETLSLTMVDSMGSSYPPLALTATHKNVTKVPSVVVYTGHLKWSPHANQEMTTLIVPYGVTDGAFFGLYYQWTKDPVDNTPKRNVAIRGRFKDVEVWRSGRITATYEEGDYKYEFTFDSDKGYFFLSLKGRRLSDSSQKNEFVVAYKL